MRRVRDWETAWPEDGERWPRPGAAFTKPRRKPVFTLTPEQVIPRCLKQGHCLWVAGQVLALMSLMKHREWTIKELAEHSRVSRAHLSEILSLKTAASTKIQHILAQTFGLEIFEFHMLTGFSLRAEVSG